MKKHLTLIEIPSSGHYASFGVKQKDFKIGGIYLSDVCYDEFIDIRILEPGNPKNLPYRNTYDLDGSVTMKIEDLEKYFIHTREQNLTSLGI